MPLWVLLVPEELGLDPLAHDDEGELDFLHAGLLENLLDSTISTVVWHGVLDASASVSRLQGLNYQFLPGFESVLCILALHERDFIFTQLK